MPSVKFPADAFRTATRDYAREDWTKGVDACFWRELLQNARDAGASRVEINVKTEGTTTTVMFEDNGKGMDRETLEKGMLTYSGTIKPNGAAGGFGMAKCLLVFAPTSCQIETGELNVYVQGIEYDFVEPKETVNGTRFTIVIDNAGFDTDKQITPTIEGLRFLMERSDMGAMKVFCNNERIWNTSLVSNGEPVRNWEEHKACAYHLPKETPVKNKSDNAVVVVQHRGIWVMDMSVNQEVKGAVWINITEDPTKCLNASRVSLSHYSLRNTIENFINELSQAPQSAIRSKKFVQKWEGSLKQINDPLEKERKIQQEKEEKERQAKRISEELRYAKMYSEDKQKSVSQWVKDNSDMVSALLKPLSDSFIQTAEFDADRLNVTDTDTFEIRQQLELLTSSPAFMLVNDKEEQDIPRQYYPDTMGSNVKKILSIWSEMIKQFLLLTRSYGVTYGVGFIFSDDAQAEWRVDNGVTWFLLNPVNDKGEFRFDLSDNKSRSIMVSTAAHEVTHEVTQGNYHGDTFSVRFTEMMALALDNLQFFNAIWKNKGK